MYKDILKFVLVGIAIIIAIIVGVGLLWNLVVALFHVGLALGEIAAKVLLVFFNIFVVIVALGLMSLALLFLGSFVASTFEYLVTKIDEAIGKIDNLQSLKELILSSKTTVIQTLLAGVIQILLLLLSEELDTRILVSISLWGFMTLILLVQSAKKGMRVFGVILILLSMFLFIGTLYIRYHVSSLYDIIELANKVRNYLAGLPFDKYISIVFTCFLLFIMVIVAIHSYYSKRKSSNNSLQPTAKGGG
jgi:hypothetical protein